ncbi:OLC1v1016584C1 [Oldenlandia corymbosa var. corymbosa]|uniref:OLC1v1016584C1 n=1 Tax=Oldenlandia corymbosa var. corymbosa TaxID=529605 RepID=A0AAV1E6G2_OLDCO|nr:OLC1v1016584C1 [Oldenlandia corymbosa var. corymbosa]
MDIICDSENVSQSFKEQLSSFICLYKTTNHERIGRMAKLGQATIFLAKGSLTNAGHPNSDLMHNSGVPLDSLEDFGGDGEDYSILFATDEEFAKKDGVVAWVKGMGMANDSKTQITGCKFKLYVHLVDGKWRIRVYPGEFGMHNHELFDEDHPTKGLSDGEKQLIQGMSKDGCRPCQIMAAIERIFPDEKVNRRQVYNFRKKLRNEGFPVLGESSAMDVATKTLSVAKHHGYIIMIDCNQETDVVESNNQDEYNKAVAVINRRWQSFPRVLTYIQKTWLVVDYKFIKAWTNAVFHMGNTTTGRVESAHKQLKTWLETSTASLDTLWAKAQEWKEETNDRCDHVVYWTCRIPCACVLKKAADTGTSITLKHIHPFWATLNIGEQAGTSAPSDVDDEVLYTRQLMEGLNECPKAVQRTVNRVLHDIMHPDQCGFKQPEEVKRRKGRPKGAKSKKKAEANTLAHEQSSQKKKQLLMCGITGTRCKESQPQLLAIQDKIYGTSCQEEVHRIRWSGQGFAPERHWMCVTDLFVVATMNNAIVYYYGAGEETQSLNSTCWTILPVTARGEATCPAFEIGVCHHGIYKHFIRINLDGDFPVPPIHNRWTKEHQPSVTGWELPLLPRIQDWYRLVPSNHGRPIGDYANDFIDLSFLY